MKKLLTLLVLVGLLFSLQASFVGAQEPPVDEPTPIDEPPADEPPAAELPVDEPPADEPPADEPPVDETPVDETPPVDEAQPDESVPDQAEEARTESSGADVGVTDTLPGSFSSEIIAIANLLASGSPESPVLTLYDIDSSGDTVVSVPAVYPGGVGFVTSDQFSTGRYAGVIESSFPAGAAVLTVNSSAKTADAYVGVNEPSQNLYGTLIFNKHANFESTLICQNTGGSATSITAQLYKTGEASPRVTLTENNVAAYNSVVWDIADNVTVQAAWPGGTGQFGYATFSSSNEIACVVDNQRMASPHVQSQFNGVPTTYAGMDLRVPLVFNGHGGSSSNSRGLKWNTGISLVNINAAPADVSVVYTAGAYTNTCSKQIPGNGSDVWYAPEVGTPGSGWTCTGGPLDWSYPGGPTFGSAQISSSVGILAIANGNRYDSGDDLGAGYSSLGAAPSGATNKSICPIAFNKDPGTNWVTGIQAANIGSETIDIVFKMVRANADPSTAGNSVPITRSSIGPGGSATVYFPETAGALTDFQGAVFVEATSSTAKISVSSSNTSYTAAGAAALYDCVNY